MKHINKIKFALFCLKAHKACLLIMAAFIFARIVASVGFYAIGGNLLKDPDSSYLGIIIPIVLSAIFLLLARALNKKVVDASDY